MAANVGMLLCFLPVLLGVGAQAGKSSSVNGNTFKAAVYDSPPRERYEGPQEPSRSEVLEVLRPRMKAYDRTAHRARHMGANILIFPEYGLYPTGLTYRTMTHFAESIPPVSLGWNPCKDPARFRKSDLQRLLSCLARRHGMYVVANLGDLVPCGTPQHNCSCKETFQYNTNVAYGPTGRHLATYHKYNLFFEMAYDTPPEPEHSYFDTPFGRVGTIVCFDLLFYEPTIPLIEHYGVDTIAFPTAWMNVLPYFSAVPFHSSFAVGMHVNYLSSNIHDPADRFSGSGVFSPNKTLVYRNDEHSDAGALLVADVPIMRRTGESTTSHELPNGTTHAHAKFGNNVGASLSSSVTSVTDELKDTPSFQDTPTFQNEVFGDTWTFAWLLPGNRETTVCHNELCCDLSYDLPNTTDHWALGAFDGLHLKEGTYYLQICGFLRCASDDPTTCGDPGVRTSSSRFDRFDLQGNYSTPYRFPQVVTEEGNPSSGQWEWDGTRLAATAPTEHHLVSAIVLSRVYERD